MEERETLILSSDDAGGRLDRLLAERFPTYSRSYFQFLIHAGAVLVNGECVKKRALPKEGDEVEVCFLLTPKIDLAPENIPLEILFEDDHLLAINKPSGMVVHPAPGSPSGTFVNALLYHCKGLPGSDALRPGIVHRLDKETTGVLLAAKTEEAHRGLITLFSTRQIQKKYIAMCAGNPGERTISAPIGRHRVRRKEMCVDLERGREAITKVRVLKTGEHLSLVEIDLLTGRTHQIRVHLKHVGCPVLGDPTYGSSSLNAKWKVERQLLHAQEISFVHPIEKKNLRLSAPLPIEMSSLISHFFCTIQK